MMSKRLSKQVFKKIIGQQISGIHGKFHQKLQDS